LKKFDSLVKSNKMVSYKSGYKHGLTFSKDKHAKESNVDGRELKEIKNNLEYANRTINAQHNPNEEGIVAAIADRVMTYAVKTGDPSLALRSALLYEKLQRGSSPSTKNRLLNSIKNSKETVNEGILFNIEGFLNSNVQEDGGVEKKVLTSIFGIATAVGILFGINSLTGAVIGFGNAPSGFLGAVLFVGGIAGLYFSFKKS